MRLNALLVAAVTVSCDSAPRRSAVTHDASSRSTALTPGEAQFWRDQFDSARATFRLALANAEARDDSVEQARALTWLSRTSYRLGDYETARRDGERGLEFKERIGLRDELFESLNTLGLLAWNQGRLVEADSMLARAARAATAAGDQLGVGKASGNRGLVLVELGDYARARAGIEAMDAAGRMFKDSRVTGNALANLAMLDLREGDPRTAITRLAEARQLYRQVKYATGEANALGQLATAWRDMGDFRAAHAAADSALQLARRFSLRQEEAAELEVIATLYREAGDFAMALRRLQEAQEINDSLDLKVETGTDLRREAEIRLELGQRRAAIEGGRGALGIHATVGAQPERLADLLFLGNADSAGSAAWLRQARILADSMKHRTARAEVALSEAQLAVSNQRWEEAVRAVRAAAAARQSSEPAFRWQLAEAEASAYRGIGKLEDAEAAARRAVEAVEYVRGSLGPSWSQAQFLASRAGSFVALAEILLARGKVDEAFSVADAARGRALLEHLAGIDSTEARRGTVLASLATRERAIRRMGDLERQLAALDDDVTPAGAQTRIRLRRQLAELQSQYVLSSALDFRASPSAATLGAARVEVGQVRAVLAPDEALVEYLIGPSSVRAFVISRARARQVALPATASQLASRVRLVRDMLGRPGPFDPALPVLEALHAQLIAPLSREGWLDGVRRVVIVPQGVLGYLPFGALRDAVRGRYLVEDRSVLLSPSAGTLVALRRLHHDGASERGAGGVVALAPFPTELPGTMAELTGIARAVSTTETLRGSLATEPAARDASRRARILHLATHGVLNPDNPLFSRVELQSVTPRSAADGRLEVHEVLGLRVTSSLVYLSGCETAVGPMGAFTRGDDLVTLAQSFLFAGARGVIATLWRVPDAGSVPLVESFYQRIGHLSPADALAEAQRELIGSIAYRSPYYWAAYVLSGDDSSPLLGDR